MYPLFLFLLNKIICEIATNIHFVFFSKNDRFFGKIIEKENGKWLHHGDSIDVAFLALGLKAKVDTTNTKINTKNTFIILPKNDTRTWGKINSLRYCKPRKAVIYF